MTTAFNGSGIPADPAPAPPPAIETVMLVVAEPAVRALIVAHLQAAGCFALAPATVGEARRLASQVVPDVLVLDVDGLSDADRRWADALPHGSAPKTVRTALLSSQLPSVCADEGARCDTTLCIAKPFDARDLVGRLLGLLRRAPAASSPPTLGLGRIELARDHPTVRLRGPHGWRTAGLAWTEHRLLAFLLSDPTGVHSREAIRRAVWPDAAVDLRTVDQNVRRLRRSLAVARASDLVRTVSGAGYRLELDALGDAGDDSRPDTGRPGAVDGKAQGSGRQPS